MKWRDLLSKPAAATALFLGLCAAASAQNVYAYEDQLENGWQNWSWGCTTDFANTQHVYSGKYSIKTTITGGWQGLFFGTGNSFPNSYFWAIHFFINGGATAGRKLTFAAYVNGAAKPAVNLNNYIAAGQVPANSWSAVTVPLSVLGLAPTDQIQGFWLQDSSGGAQPAFWVDEICLEALKPPVPDTIGVNPNLVVQGALQPTAFGVNTAVWDDNFNSPVLDNLLSAANFHAFRFPGGSLSDNYHWQTNETNDGTFWTTNFDTFAGVAAPMGAQGVITTNYGTGTANEAAAWVQYSDSKNYGFKYWEVGNECYGGWEMDTHARPHDPYTYAQQFAAYYAAIKKMDPTAKVGAVCDPGEDTYVNYTDHPATNPVTGVVHNGWTPVMLSTLAKSGVVPDFLIYHRYPIPAGNECDFSLLQVNPSFKTDISAVRAQLTDYYTNTPYAATAAKTQILCTENNSNGGTEGKEMVSIVNGLFLADSFGTMIQTECKGYLWWDLINGQNTTGNNGSWLYGWREYGDEGLVAPETFSPYPMYYIEKLISDFAQPGDSVVESYSSNGILAAYATKRQDGTVRLMIINKHATMSVSANVNFSGGFVPASTGTSYQYGIPQDTAAETGTGSQDVATAAVTNLAPTTVMTFPPYSATVLVLTPKS